ncbi:MAG TPA: hypothetical protein VNN77_14945 [candidate division Zixibacteria bacterium]|nr:hypothetical protein [candidate division Zixibacteria bacterium]
MNRPLDSQPAGARGADEARTRGRLGRLPSRLAWSLLSTRVARHLAVLACLLIVRAATHPGSVGQLEILLVVVSAALLHSAGRSLQRRLPEEIRPPQRP